jgi:hypothetical protein
MGILLYIGPAPFPHLLLLCIMSWCRDGVVMWWVAALYICMRDVSVRCVLMPQL